MQEITVMLVGDVILDEPNPDSYFDPARATLLSSDLVVGQLEVPHSETTEQVSTDIPASPSDPAALSALPAAGFGIMALAGNHVYDAGATGLLDTIRHSAAVGLLTTGAGPNIAAARQPAIVELGGVRVAVLSYNCVGPRESWATSRKPGCAYVHILTHYELDHASPGGPPRIYTFAEPDDVDQVAADVAEAKAAADIVIVSYHKGVGHTPAILGMYESPLSRATIDAGADVVFGHHAHIMRGIEVYRGRPIYHGLGNFVTVTHALSPVGNASAERELWAKRREQLYGFATDPTMPFYPFHPQSRNTIIATVRAGRAGLTGAGFIPCWIDDAGRPVPKGRGDGGQSIVDYVADIGKQMKFEPAMSWRDDREVNLDDVTPPLPRP